MLTEFEYIRCITESLIIQDNYDYIKDRGGPEFQDIYLIDISDIDMLAQEHREDVKKEKRRLLDLKFATKNKGSIKTTW